MPDISDLLILVGAILWIAAVVVAARHSGYQPGTGYEAERRGAIAMYVLMGVGTAAIGSGMMLLLS